MILTASFFALFATLLIQSVAPLSERFKGYMTAGATLILSILFFRQAEPILAAFKALGQKAETGGFFTPLFKGLGISFLVSFTASFCRDLGEDSIAKKLEICGKAAVLYLALPLVGEILSLMEEVLG
jgi:stage III sporulation protein AD